MTAGRGLTRAEVEVAMQDIGFFSVVGCGGETIVVVVWGSGVGVD